MRDRIGLLDAPAVALGDQRAVLGRGGADRDAALAKAFARLVRMCGMAPGRVVYISSWRRTASFAPPLSGPTGHFADRLDLIN
jgi:hypothetical protein